MSTLVENDYSNSSTTATVTSTPLPGDVVVYGFTTSRSTPRTPTALPVGLGATWTQVLAGRTCLYVGTGATTAGDITTTLTGTDAILTAGVWLLRGVGTDVLATGSASNGVGETVIPDSATVGGDDVAVLALASGGSSSYLTAASLPSLAAWTVDHAPYGLQAWIMPTVPTMIQPVADTDSATPIGIGYVALGTMPPPQPPTGLAVTAADETTLTVGWTAPATGPAPTSYEVRIDGGAPVDVGLVTSTVLSGLTASTTYAVEVRALVGSSSSAWAGPIVATTTAPPALPGYGTHLRVGTHSWDVASTDDPAYGPLAGLRYAWAAPQDDGWPTQHPPTVLVFGVIVEAGVDFDDVDKGTPIHFTFTPDGYTTPLVEFGGTVRDLVATPHRRGMLYTITALDYLLKLHDYKVAAPFANGEAIAAMWPKMLQDAAGAGGGVGITPALPDPFAADPPDVAGWWGRDAVVEASAWDALVGYLSTITQHDGVLGRGILDYRLDASGNLDAAQPYVGTWTTPTDDAPLALSAGGWPAGGNVDACLLRTDATSWQRQRVEPNKVVNTGASGSTYTRPGTTGDVVREVNYDGNWWESILTDPLWIIAGVDAVNQWSTEFSLLAHRDPAVVDGWFDLPAAMMHAVGCYGIDPRHTPDGSGRMVGVLGAASLHIPPGGRWEVRFRLRRTLPD